VVLDNQVAALQVGDTVPITTGNANILNSATASSNTVFSSVTYQNTGIVLSFRPHVHANGNVNLEIDQEISACKNCIGINLTPSFTDRHVKSSIQVPNGQTVLLAGLIQEEHDKTRAGIPVLDQIPILGEAFANNNINAVVRTELIVFIRPQIIRDSVDASVVAEELRSKMRGDKIGTLHPPGAVTPYPFGLVQ
jgi:general secretion pathway protein D